MLKPQTGRISARRYNDRVGLVSISTTTDDYGEATPSTPVSLGEVWADVKRLSATRQLYYYEKAEVVGLEINIRYTSSRPQIIQWENKEIVVKSWEDVDNRHRELRMIGSYKQSSDANGN